MQAAELSEPELLAEALAKYQHNPLGYAYWSFPWGEAGKPLAKHKGPRKWQAKILSTIGEHLSNPETRFDPLQIAVSSGHGIGKSALIAMIIGWGMDTMVDTKIVVTANTDTQLKTKTVPEVTKWMNMRMAADMFTMATQAMYSKAKKHIKTWRCDFMPWSEHNTEAFAGLHNEGKRIIVIYDEASGISDKVWEVTEGALTDEGTEIIWIAFGNPTVPNKRFHNCFKKFRKMWKTWCIDSRDVEGTNKKLFEKWKEVWGEDSDFFKIRVRGMFPATSMRQFIPGDKIEEANGRRLPVKLYDFAPKILTCDPAWTGEDSLEIGLRQGLSFRILRSIPKNDDDVAIANLLGQLQDEHQADAVFIDGGFGTGIFSVGKSMHRHNWTLVWSNEASLRQDCVNKRAEMMVMVREWILEGGSFEEDDELAEEMNALETVPQVDGKFKFPPKDAMREILGRSPGKLDSLGLSFALPVVKSKEIDQYVTDDNGGYADDYDPYK